MPKFLEQTVYYCDQCNAPYIPAPKETDCAAIAVTDFNINKADLDENLDIANVEWRHSIMNTFFIPYYYFNPLASEPDEEDNIDVHLQKTLAFKEVCLCGECAKALHADYDERVLAIQEWAIDAGLL